ncbi:MAG: hypothetical protein ACLP7Q_08005 [Isosphaeraceae bacterium]
MPKQELEIVPQRQEVRQLVAVLVITAAVALCTGVLLRQSSMLGANDISRWCTVWGLLERGTYEIDQCPWLVDTQDKVFRTRESSAGSNESPRHYYSSKPALLSTLIAGFLYPARRLSGVPLEKVVLQEREERWTQKADENCPGKVKGVLEKPKEDVKWPAYVFYFKTVLVVLNIVPFAIFLILYARVLDRFSTSDWSWLFSLVAAAFGTYLTAFVQTLNNHTVAAFSAFFALYQFLRIWDDDDPSPWRFSAVGLFAAFTAANEIPALAFLGLVWLFLLVQKPRKTLLFLTPAALVPIVASVAAQYAALGELKLAYSEFGTESYLWEGSLWKTPQELDALNLPWFDPEQAARRGIASESNGIYLFHMTLGHHGFWSLTPIFVFSLVGLFRLIRGGQRSLTVLAWMTAVLTVILLAFYTWNPKARNYGGSTQGLRWLFWIIPFWLLMLPRGIESGQHRGWVRALAVVCLFVSVVSVGYAMRNPWTHPWLLDALEHLGVIALPR